MVCTYVQENVTCTDIVGLTKGGAQVNLYLEIEQRRGGLLGVGGWEQIRLGKLSVAESRERVNIKN